MPIKLVTSCKIVALVILFALVADNIFAQTNVTVCLKASDGITGLQGATVQYAPGGTWFNFGTTGADGCVSLDLPSTYTNVKIKITYNQGSREITQNIQTNPYYEFQTSETYVQVIDHLGNGIQGALITQGGGFWYDHGYTGSDGKLFLEMFLPGNYRFRATANFSSQTLDNQPMPVIYQTGLVKRDNEYTGTIRASLIGGWRQLWPTAGASVELLPGTYTFQYNNPEPAGGSPEAVSVVAGQTTIIPWGGSVTSYTLTINALNGSVTKNPDLNSYSSGTEVEITAIADLGYDFVNWTGDLSSTDNPAFITMNSDKTITANFELSTLTLTYLAGTGGTISGTTPQIVAYNGSGSEVIAMPDPGYVFSGWSDGLASASRTDLNVTSNLTLTALFTECTLTVDAGDDVTIYYGYAPQSFTQLNAESNLSGAVFSWSPAAGLSNTTIANPVANPTTTTVYKVTVTLDDCTAEDEVTVYVEDVRCGTGNNLNKVSIWHTTGNGNFVRLCVSANAIEAHLAHGDVFVLGKDGAFIGMSEAPTEFKLYSNYPNPFNPSTTISYQLVEDSPVRLDIFNSLGQLVQTLVNETQSAGYYSVEWNADGFASGIYFLKMTATDFTSSQKLILMK